jgi:hypothetical protein
MGLSGIGNRRNGAQWNWEQEKLGFGVGRNLNSGFWGWKKFDVQRIMVDKVTKIGESWRV